MVFRKVLGILFSILTLWQVLTLFLTITSSEMGTGVTQATSLVRGAATGEQTVLITNIILLLVFSFLSWIFLKERD